MAEWRVLAMSDPEAPLTGTQGWRQFQSAKKKMLDAYDRAKVQAKAHEVEVFHGRIAEAQVRDWLIGFLPKRYGVTSGYIVSQGQTEGAKLPHYDVIIYDQTEAPVLWIEDSPDSSSSGSSRAVPAEFVCAVLEVKAAFNTKSVSKAFEHLADLNPLLDHIDRSDEYFRKFLPLRFFTAIIFFELRSDERDAWNDLLRFTPPDLRRAWPQALILRGDGLSTDSSASIAVTRNTNSPPMPIKRSGRDLLDYIVFSQSRMLANMHCASLLKWSSNEFSSFAFDLLAKLNGTYQPGMMSSHHGLSWTDFRSNPGA